MKSYIAACIALVVAGTVFLNPSMRGYVYITALCYGIALTIAVCHLAPDTFRRVYLILLCIGLVYFLALELCVIKNASTDPNPKRGYVIVLGASVRGETPSLSLEHRLTAAQWYLEQYPEAKAVLSGGKGSGEDISEAECMRRFLVANGIDESRLIVEDQSTSTKENLTFSREKILEDGGTLDDVAIISSPYHLCRAKTMARNLGYDNVAGVACVHGYPIYSIGMYIREAFGLTHLMVFGD